MYPNNYSEYGDSQDYDKSNYESNVYDDYDSLNDFEPLGDFEEYDGADPFYHGEDSSNNFPFGYDSNHGYDGAPGSQQRNVPPGPPPKFTPKQSSNLKAVDPRSIKHCRGDYTYVWLRNGSSFWMYPTFVGRNSISGYRWTRFGWAYIGLDLRQISSFVCS